MSLSLLLRRWRRRCLSLLIQSPRITALLKLRDRVIGHGKWLVFAQSLLEPSYDLARAPKSEGKGVSKDFASFHGFPWQKRSPG